MRRRDFLKIGGLGVAVAAESSVRVPVDFEFPGGESHEATPVRLTTERLALSINPKTGLPEQFELVGIGKIKGSADSMPMNAVVSNQNDDRIETVRLPIPTVSKAENEIELSFEAKVVSFRLRYQATGASVVIELGEIVEHQGYEFLELRMPSLVTVSESEADAWLAHGDTGGSLVKLSEASSGQLKPNTFWGDVAATLPVTMVGNSKVTCVQEVTAFMDGTALSVAGEPGSRSATLGTVKKHRVNAKSCYDLNLGSDAPRNCGSAKTPNLLIGQMSSNRLDFLPASNALGVESWMAAAKVVRDRMPRSKTSYYDDQFVYGIHCDEPKYAEPRATFSQCEELVRKVANLTAGSPQVVHLWGWQYRGKDTGYPAVAEVNSRLGGYNGLRKLMERGREVNANVTFSDNYDDAYRSSPAWDPAIIARRPDGELWESRNWTGENSYIVGLAKYMAGPGRERVRYTCEHYQLRDTTHVDVLSYFPIRNDWDPVHPASGVKNLLDGRYQILDEFAKQGVDVSSEAMRYAFIGKVSLFWHMPRPEACPFGGKPIPLMAAIYRHSAIWGEWGRADQPDRVLNSLFYSNSPHAIVETDVDFSSMLDSFYLLRLPWSKVHRLRMETFERDGDRTLIGLEGNSTVDLDWSKNTYEVKHNSVQIAKTGSTFCPMDDNRIAFYSAESRELTAPLPGGWNAPELVARSLTIDGSSEVAVRVQSSEIVVSTQSRVPVIVYRDRAAMPEAHA